MGKVIRVAWVVVMVGCSGPPALEVAGNPALGIVKFEVDQAPSRIIVRGIGADGEVIARRHNERERSGDPTAHAELLALRDAAAVVGSWRLDGLTLVVTLEPFPMCAGALVNARVKRLVYGAADLRAGGVDTVFQICANSSLNHQVEVTSEVRAEEGRRLMQAFFRRRRKAAPGDGDQDNF